MISQSRKELLELLMLDDFVDRRDALDRWEARWVATLEIEHTHNGVKALEAQFPGKSDLVAKAALSAKMVEALVEDECKAIEFLRQKAGSEHDPDRRWYVLRLRLILTEGRDA